MPGPPGTRVWIVVPLTLQIGWAENPAYFCPHPKLAAMLLIFYSGKGPICPSTR